MKTLFTVLLTILSTVAFSQEPAVFSHLDEIDKQVIPLDTAVRTGMLANGLTYYVCQHKNTEKKAFFQLLVKGGSVLEKENERGIAHFVEHVLFKGTKHFPEDDVIGFMRRNGIPFGHDSNAFTGFNTVRYILNSIPTDNEQLIDSCLLLLRDWAGDAIIDSKSVETEHNVIVEEWRSRSRNSFAQQLQNDLFDNSIYAKRLPIGDMEIVQNCSAKLVRNFYKRWYQPQNQAVVVVGDFDPDDMVKKIQDRFGDMKRGKNFAPALPALPDFEAPRVRFYQDNQLPYNSTLFMMNLHDFNHGKKQTIGDLRTSVLREKIIKIMQDKLNNLKANLKELYGSEVNQTNIADVLNTQLLAFNLDGAPENWKLSVESLAKRIELIRRKGFKDEDWKEEYPYQSPKYNIDSTAINFADTSFVMYFNHVYGSQLAEQYATAFFKGNDIISSKAKLMAEHHLKNTLTQEQLHQEFLNMTNGHNMLIALLFPEGATMPKEEEVMAVINQVKGMSDEEIAEIETTKAKKLERLSVDSLDIATIPGTVKKTSIINDSISEVLLSNGVKVVLWKMKTSDNTINYLFQRPSGYSVLSDQDIHYHDMLFNCVRKYSFEGGFSSINIEPFNDIYGTSSIKDIEKVEACLKMIHASLTSTEVDVVEFEERLKNLQTTSIATNNPVLQAQLRIMNLPAASIKRLMPPTVEEIDTYNLDRFRELVKEYYSNYNGSMLVIQGEYDTDSIMPHILKYIASLPSKPEPVKRMIWPADHYKTTNSTIVEKIENATPYCSTFIYYTWEKGYQYTQETHAHNQVLQSVLNTLLFNTLRMQHSDVYTPSCTVQDDLLPLNRMKCSIAYTCNPVQRERIAQDAIRLVQDMANGDLITKELIDSYVKEREKEQNLFKGNDFTLRSEYLTRELDGIVINKADVTYIKQVTPASLKAHLKNLLKKGNMHIGYLTTE